MPDQLSADEISGLRALLDKEAIREVLALSSRGVDRVASEILYEVYHRESVDHHGSWVGSGPEFADLPGRHAPENIMVHHALGQSLIELDGDTAFVETYFAMTYERFARKRDEVRIGSVGGRFLDRFDKRDRKWRISVRRVVMDTSHEVSQADQPPGVASFPRGQRWPDDQVFRIREFRVEG
jgi:hypothetical protein